MQHGHNNRGAFYLDDQQQQQQQQHGYANAYGGNSNNNNNRGAFYYAGPPQPRQQQQPQHGRYMGGPDQLPYHGQGLAMVPPPPPEGGPTLNYVGWGGQAIQENSQSRVPWFGRSRSKYSRYKGQGGKDEGQGRGHWDCNFFTPATAAAAFARPLEDAMTIEELVAFIQKLPKRDALPEAVYSALYHLDSRAVALVLKDLSKLGMEKRAVELFDYLRRLGERHALRVLCDVYTFTAMISLCIYQQDVDRAMGTYTHGGVGHGGFAAAVDHARAD